MGDLNFRIATISDIPSIRIVEKECFGGNLIKEEYDLIFNNEWGTVYLAEKNNKIVGYQIVLSNEYDLNIENILQPLIIKAKSSGKSIFHDDVHFDSNKYVYFHLLGVLPSYQAIGIGKQLLKYSSENLPDKDRSKRIKAIIRINNVASMKICWKILGLCATSLKHDQQDIFGSQETNMYVESGLTKKKIDKEKVFDLPVMEEKLPSANDFLLPIIAGEESQLYIQNTNILEKMANIFAEGYVIDGVYKDNNDQSGKLGYYLCRK
jgi:ribosomal protein S18 acetylase RimI-like enzyme